MNVRIWTSHNDSTTRTIHDDLEIWNTLIHVMISCIKRLYIAEFKLPGLVRGGQT